MLNDDGLSELLSFIKGDGKFSFLPSGIHTYPNRDKDDDIIYNSCLLLGSKGLIERTINEPNHVFWIPKQDDITTVHQGLLKAIKSCDMEIKKDMLRKKGGNIMAVYCKDCRFIGRLRDPNPKSICTKTPGKMNFVTGEYEQWKCKDVNFDGACEYYQKDKEKK